MFNLLSGCYGDKLRNGEVWKVFNDILKLGIWFKEVEASCWNIVCMCRYTAEYIGINKFIVTNINDDIVVSKEINTMIG